MYCYGKYLLNVLIIIIEYRKRSDYRRPSALGVPDSKFKANSEYVQNFEKQNGNRAKPIKQSENLTVQPQGGNSKSESSNGGGSVPREYQNDNNRNYQQYQDNDNKVTSNKDDYPGNYSVSRPSKATSQRQRSAMEKPSGKLEVESENRNTYGKDKPKSKAKAFKPEATMKAEGEMEFSREQDAYRPQEGQQRKRSEKLRPASNMKSEGERDFETGRADYKGYTGDHRPRKFKSADNLRTEGDRQWDTGKGDYRAYSGNHRRPDKVKAEDNLRPLSGPMERRQQQAWMPAERNKGVRPSSNMKSEGTREWSTGKEDYPDTSKINHKNSRPDKIRPSSNLGILDGRMEEMTESREKYIPQDADHAPKVRPPTSMASEGEYDHTTLYKEQLQPAVMGRPKNQTNRKNNSDAIGFGEGKIDDTTISKSSFVAPSKSDRPMKKYTPPSGNLKVRSRSADSSASNFSTTSHDYSTGFGSKRPTKVIKSCEI